MLAIEACNLTKRFDAAAGRRRLLPRPSRLQASPAPSSTVAVDDVSLAVERGELFGLIGPNGAGKTTLVKLLCTLIVPTSGAARINGFDLADAGHVQATIGLVSGDERSFYWRLSGRQNLRFFGSLHGLHAARLERQVQTVLAEVELLDVADRSFQTYSSGMRQRLAIARGLLNDPQVLFMDEPTRSLDPTATAHLHTFIRDELVRRRGVTVFLTTHRLREAELLCDRLAIIQGGRIRGCGTIADLRAYLRRTDRYQITVADLSERMPASLQAIVGEVVLTPLGDDQTMLEFDLPPAPGALAAALDAVRAGSQIRAVTSQAVPLEDVFEFLTQ